MTKHISRPRSLGFERTNQHIAFRFVLGKLRGIVLASYKTERDCIVVCGAQLGKLTANFERRFQLEQDGLLKEDLARLQAESPHLGLGHLYSLPGAGAANYE